LSRNAREAIGHLPGLNNLRETTEWEEQKKKKEIREPIMVIISMGGGPSKERERKGDRNWWGRDVKTIKEGKGIAERKKKSRAFRCWLKGNR